MLKLPSSFKNDIQGKDTALVPVISISPKTPLSPEDIIYLSTNNITLDFASGLVGSVHCKPLLLNIPSLKESIDIEKRNYKISSINIDISNFPYEGKRFSELVGDTSLINYECRVFWVSPSVGGIAWADIIPDLPPNDNWAFQVFNGTIRRYTHDDEKVRLVVEDRSQATLHKDLPLPENYLGTDDSVPDKYKNKPIPMVYGHVDRSPLVISENYRKFQADSETMIFLRTVQSGYTNVVDDNILLDSLEVDIDDEFHHVVSDGQYEYLDNHIGLLPEVLSGIVVGTEDSPDSFEEVSLTCRKIAVPRFSISNPRHDSTLVNVDFLDPSYNVDSITAITDGSLNINDIELLGERVSNDSYQYAYTLGHIEKLLLSINMDVTPQHDTVLDDNDKPTGNKILGFKINTYNLPKFLGDKVLKANHWNGMEGQLGDVTSVSDTYDNYYNLIWRDGDLHSDIIQEVFGFLTYGTAAGVQGIDVPTDYDGSTAGIKLEFSSVGDETYGLDMPIILFSGGLNNTFNIQFRTLGHYAYPAGDSSTIHRLELTGHIDEIGLLVENKAIKIFTKDFYANVNGRAMTQVDYPDDIYVWGMLVMDFPDDVYSSPTAPKAIAHILNNELGQDVEATGTYDTWKYAFTIDKKINSKKLIEGIASASPYIPRFNNMGEFKFTEIPMDGNPVFPATVQTIKEADVVDFSFSRTKIEDVYTKIEFKYNWDYAREEFNDSVEADIEDMLEDYKLDYYGLTDPVELVIDGEQGKYIRNHDTAQSFAEWYLMWSCNQKLKLKIKLPLKMMFLEIGDFVGFDALLGGVKPYGIDYTADGDLNGQEIFKNFLILSTNKTLEWVEIEAIMMHNLDVEYVIPTIFEAEPAEYTVIASNELNGVLVADIYEEFPELGNLIYIAHSSGVAEYYSAYGWYGSLTNSSIVGGDTYTIKFSQETTTNLFNLLDD